MVFLVDRSRIMQKGGFVEWIWRLVSGSSGSDGQRPPNTEQLPDYLRRLLRRVADRLFLRWSGDDFAWFDVVDWNLKDKLETNKVINWCSQTGALYPIKINEIPESASTSLHDEQAQSVTADSSDLNASIEFLHHVIRALREDDEQLLSNFQSLMELSILTLANLIGQSIVVFCLPDFLNHLAGIYLPSYTTGQQYRKYPLVLTFYGDLFVPLLHPKWECGISETTLSATVPLVTRDLKFLTIKSLAHERLRDYDVLLDFLDISVKRDKERDNYFFVASSDEGPVLRMCAKHGITTIETPESDDDNSIDCEVKEYLDQRKVKRNSNPEEEKTNLNRSYLDENVDQRKVEIYSNSEKEKANLSRSYLDEKSDLRNVEIHSNAKKLDTIFNDSTIFSNNISVLELNSVKLAKILSNCSSSSKHDSSEVFAIGSREKKVSHQNKTTTVEPSHRFRITEIEVENSSNRFQRCLALGCNNLVADKKTFPLCRACSEKQIKIDKGEPEVNVRWNSDHSVLTDALEIRAENIWCH